jgi:lycopene beta-cyclase
MSKQSYDYIIAGGGLSGLSLASKIVETPGLSDRKVLVIDQNLEPNNNKTWSFWHKGPPPFADLVYKSWKQVEVVFNGQSIIQPLDDYTYHSIHSGEFRAAILEQLKSKPNVDLIEAPIRKLKGGQDQAMLQTPDHDYAASYIFQSCFTPPKIKKDVPHYPLIQHFLGWEVETTDPLFDPSTITLMDFDPNFSGGIAFIYILPQSSTKALVEYTIFSDQTEQKGFYEEKLTIYLHNKFNLRPLDYRTHRTEYGEIPMQDHPYAPWYEPRILNMGTVGGLTKPSTGYTFSRIQHHVDAIVKQLAANGKPALPWRSPLRYRAYDLWLLQILYDEPEKGIEIFRQLFSNNSMDQVFRFLSEENSLPQDFRTMSRVSYRPFLRAIGKTRKRLFEI